MIPFAFLPTDGFPPLFRNIRPCGPSEPSETNTVCLPAPCGAERKGANRKPMKWIDRLERRARGLAVPNLMFFLSGAMLLVYILQLFFPMLPRVLSLDRSALLHGQVWRLLTFLAVPPSSSPLWILFNLYFYCLLGRGLEQQWGVFRFNLYYLCGMVGAILTCLITGYGTNYYLNLSLFLAFAAFYPDYRLMLFFVLPVKIKYLAMLDGVLLLVSFVLAGWPDRIAILMSLVNIVIFFGGSSLKRLKTQMGYWKTRRNFRKYMR